MFGLLRGQSPPRPRRFRAEVEALEDRSVPATISVVGAGRFGDAMVASLVNVGGDKYTAINLRSAIVGANSLAGNDTVLLETGTYKMNGGQGQLVVTDPSGNLTIQNKSGGVSTIDAQGESRIFLNQSGLTLSGLKLQNGFASDRGGAIFNNGTLTVINSQFVNNEARGSLDGGPVQGGAIFNYANRILNVQNSTFTNNVARGGTSSILLRGTADARGGAIYFSGGFGLFTSSITGSTFTGNQAIGGNGAVVNGFGARGGHATGGAIFAEAGSYDLNVINATFAANVAQGGKGSLGDGGHATGGALFLQNGGTGTVRLVNDTISGNKALGGQGNGTLATSGASSGGGLAGNFLGMPLAKVINTIIAKNGASMNSDVDGVFASLGSNLIGDNTGAAASFNAATGDFVGTFGGPLDPGLDPLGNHGGTTQTFRLRTDSFAIDRGKSTVVSGVAPVATKDQRGQPRRSGIDVDIGAFEFAQKSLSRSYSLNQGITLTTTATSSLLAGVNNPLGKTVTAKLVSNVPSSAGKVTLNANGTFTYKPAASFYGTTSFQFRVVVDGQEGDAFTATLKVNKTGRR
jgi:hypothetical protein